MDDLERLIESYRLFGPDNYCGNDTSDYLYRYHDHLNSYSEYVQRVKRLSPRELFMCQSIYLLPLTEQHDYQEEVMHLDCWFQELIADQIEPDRNFDQILETMLWLFREEMTALDIYPNHDLNFDQIKEKILRGAYAYHFRDIAIARDFATRTCGTMSRASTETASKDIWQVSFTGYYTFFKVVTELNTTDTLKARFDPLY